MVSIKKNWPFFFGLIFTSILLWPLFQAPYFTHHDDVQIIRLYEMSKCFKDSQFPCRWVPDLGGLYGYPLFNYYAPLAYYFGYIIFFLTNSLLISFKIMFAFSFLGSFIFMYLFASRYWGKLGGSLSAIFYAYAPYHALDFYVRGAMGEMWALMFFPAIFWSAVKLEEHTSIKNLLLLAIFMAGLMTSHNLSAMVFLPITAVWLVILFFKKKSIRFFRFSLLSIILAILMSSFYLLPLIFEKNLVHVDTTVSGYFYFTEHFKGLKKLFIERSWGYGTSVREVPGGERDGISYQIGWVHILSWLLAIISAKVLWRKNRFFSFVIIFSSFTIIMAIFMVHPRSDFIWKMIDPLKYLQFPWRLLLIIIFFISFIAGAFLHILQNKKYANIMWLLLTLLVVILNFSYFKPEKYIQIKEGELLSGPYWQKQIMRSIFDYLPIYAKEPPADPAPVRYQILTGKAQVDGFEEGTNWFNFKLKTEGYTIIRLSQYYFPNWIVLVNGQQAHLYYKNNALGLMTLILDKGDFEINARLYDTPVRTLGNAFSVLGILLALGLYLTQVQKIRKGIYYYLKAIN